MAISWRPAPIPKPTITTWLPMVKKSWRGDTIAGITLWGLVVPEAIAYSGLAGLPPTSGIWAIIFVLPIYAIWGRSRHLVASPTSAIAVTSGSLIAAFATDDPRQAGAIVALTVGGTFLLAYFLKLGFLVHFISEPINAGFMFGIAVFVTISQLNKLLGVEGSHGTAISRLAAVIGNLGKTNWVTVGLAVLATAVMLLIPRINRRIPAGLVMIVITSLVVAGLNLANRFGVDTPGAIKTGFPELIVPSLGKGDVTLLMTGAVGIVLVAFSEASAVASTIAAERGYDYDANQDLFPLGIGNAVSGAFGGLSGAGSMTSSSENVEAGAKTPFSTIITAAAALITVLFFGGAVANLPEAALAVLIIFAVRNHLSLAFLPRIFGYSRIEAVIAALTALGVLVLGVLNGLVLAMALSALWYVVRTSRVSACPLGLSSADPAVVVSDTNPNYEAFPEGVVGLRFSGDIFYGNVERAAGMIDEASLRPGTTAVVVETSQGLNDYTSIKSSLTNAQRLRARNVWLVIVNTRSIFREDIKELGTPPANLLTVHGSEVRGLFEKIQKPFHEDESTQKTEASASNSAEK